jgi:hypothetical protein
VVVFYYYLKILGELRHFGSALLHPVLLITDSVYKRRGRKGKTRTLEETVGAPTISRGAA